MVRAIRLFNPPVDHSPNFTYTGVQLLTSVVIDITFFAPNGTDLAGVPGQPGSWSLAVDPVPGPLVGAGLPGLLMAVAGFIGWRCNRRSAPTMCA
jgi:hypothetical protein